MTKGRLLALLSILMLTVCPTFAATISDLGLFGTGVNVAGGIATSWTVNSGNAFVVTPLVGGWSTAAGTSQWISDMANGHLVAQQTDGLYNYTTSFTVPAQYTLSSIVIQGFASFDDTATGSIGGTQFFNSGAGTFFNTTTNFTITGLTQAANTITFAVTNLGLAGNTGANPTGLRVEFTSITGDAIPEPSTLALLGGGLLALGFLRRRR